MDWLVFGFSFGYGLLHSLLAADRVKALFGRLGRSRHYRIAYNTVAILALAGLLWLMVSQPVIFWMEPGLLWQLLGALLVLAGLLLGWLAFRHYDAGEFLGLWRSTAPEGLHTAGPNAWVRHPLYGATLLLLAGMVILVPQRVILSAALGLVCYLPAGIYWEEQKLLRQFGPAYEAYQKQVKRLIPGIW